MLTTQHSKSQWLLHCVLLSLVFFVHKKRLLFFSFSLSLFHFHLFPCAEESSL